MKHLLIFLLLATSAGAYAQFPAGTDTLRNFNNRFIDNDPRKAFTNLRLHNLLAGIIDNMDSIATGGSINLGMDTLWAQNDSTLVYRKNGLFYTVIVRGRTGAGPIYRVPFSDGAHLVNDSNFKFDKSQGADASRLIVGPTTITTGGLAKINATSDNMNALGLTSYGTGLNTIVTKRARGSISAPTKLLSGDDLWNISGRGFDGINWVTSGRAAIYARTTQDWAPDSNGTVIVIATTSKDSGVIKERMIVGDSVQVKPVVSAIGDSIAYLRRNANGLSTLVVAPKNKILQSDTIITNGIRTPVILPDTLNENGYTFIILPDLQGMADLHPEQLRAMRQWFIDSAVLQNVSAVLTVGDYTDFATTTEFDRVDSLFDVIESLNIPWLPVIGNHDYDPGQISSSGDRALTTKFNSYFGVSRFVAKPYWGAAFHNKTENAYIKFQVGSTKYLALGLEFIPTDSAMNWAQSVLDSNQDRRAIICTHAYMTVWGERAVDTSAFSAPAYGLTADNNGQEMWEKFIRKNKTIDFVFGGHYIIANDTSGYFKRISEAGNKGNAIHQFVINYQEKGRSLSPCCELNNGKGYFLKMRSSPNEAKNYMSVFSPYLNTYDPQADSFYVNYPVTKIEGSASIENGEYVRGEVRLDSALFLQKLPRDRVLITRENGRVDTLPNQAANTFFAGPSTGSAANASFRAMVASDIVSGSNNYIQNQSASDQSASFRISGAGIIGTSVSSTAKLSVNNGGGGNTLAIGPLLSNSIPNTFHCIDTVTTANLVSQKLRLFQYQRDSRFTDDGLTITDHKSGLIGNVVRFKNTLTWTPANAAHGAGNLSTINLRQFGGFTGSSILTGPTSPGNAVTAQAGQIDLVNAGGSSLIAANGYWSSFNAYLTLGTRDTIENYIAYNSAVTSTGTIKNYYYNYMPAAPGQFTWGLYQTNSGVKNYINGNLMIGSSTDNSIGKLQVTGKATVSTIDSTNGAFHFLYQGQNGELLKSSNMTASGIAFNGRKRNMGIYIDPNFLSDATYSLKLENIYRNAADNADSMTQKLSYSINGVQLEQTFATGKTSLMRLSGGVVNIIGDSLVIGKAVAKASADSIYAPGPPIAGQPYRTLYMIPNIQNTTLAAFRTDANNSGTSETDLYSYTLPANKLEVDDKSIRFEVSGAFNDATATPRIKLLFAGNTIFDSGVLTISVLGFWKAEVLITRSSSSTAEATVTFSASNVTGNYETITDLTSLDFTTTNILKVTGTATGATGGSNDITAKHGLISIIPAP